LETTVPHSEIPIENVKCLDATPFSFPDGKTLTQTVTYAGMSKPEIDVYDRE
jgi:hypothetical protein